MHLLCSMNPGRLHDKEAVTCGPVNERKCIAAAVLQFKLPCQEAAINGCKLALAHEQVILAAPQVPPLTHLTNHITLHNMRAIATELLCLICYIAHSGACRCFLLPYRAYEAQRGKVAEAAVMKHPVNQVTPACAGMCICKTLTA